MASLSIQNAQISPSPGLPNVAPRHARKHSRHPTAAPPPLPTFSFNPGTSGDETPAVAKEKDEDVFTTAGSGHMRRPSKPIPLPAFSFNPGADLPVERQPSPTHPVLEEMALNQQRVSKSARPAPLPVFTFNPGQANSSSTSSPTKGEADNEGIRPSGHRRGGSEFVGGNAEGAQLVVSSPGKQDLKPAGPPVSGMRGHSHKRSQAISVSDIDTSDLIKQHALAKARAPSNPSTPRENTFPFPRPSPSQRHSLPTNSRSPPGSPRRRENISAYRSRTVDFSDTVDVIPRPLSMISSETERSNSTIRGHSLSNSINSLASPPPESIMESPMSISPPTMEPFIDRRPNTADASLLFSQTAREDQKNLLSIPKRPLSASGSPMISSAGSPPTKKKHFWSAHGNDPSPTPTPAEERADPFTNKLPTDLSIDHNRTRPKTAPERPSTHKRRKYHTWTAGIFSKKSKHRSKGKSKRSPTPPVIRRNSDQVNEIFDADDTVVLREGSPVGNRKLPKVAQAPPLPPLMSMPSDAPGPIIDLDAALGHSESDRRHSDDNARRTTTKISKLHSSERRGIVDAFGVSHRRTESAPALSPVNRSALFGTSRHGSNASLSEDVFDEEEEDNFLAKEEKTKSLPKSQQAATMTTGAPRESGLGLTNVPSHNDGVLIVDPEDDTESEDVRSSKSTIEAPTIMEEDMPKRPATSPMPFAYPNPQLHYASSTEGRTTSASLISSPDAEHVSFDDRSRSRRFGEHNPDFLRPSTDDLPSLSDSVSSSAFPRGSSSGNARPSLDHRSNSMFVPGSSRLHENWKRSSLASLNRLIPGSSHGSKTKLEGLPTSFDDKTKKKNNRLSKLMRFWRSKEEGERDSMNAPESFGAINSVARYTDHDLCPVTRSTRYRIGV